MIVVDASVALKWGVNEPGHLEALRILETDHDFAAPDLIFAELTNVLRRKLKLGEVTSEQAMRTIDAVRSTLSTIIGAADLWRDALELSQMLDHSAYDCFYLAAAVGSGMFVSADEKFLRKCREGGFAAFVCGLTDGLGDSLVLQESLIYPVGLIEDVRRLASLIETTFAELGGRAASAQEGVQLRMIPSTAYGPGFDSPAYRRLADILKSLSADQLSALVALGWLGRTNNAADAWPVLLANARRMAEEGFDHHSRYFVAQMSKVSNGLEKLRAAQSQIAP